MKHDMKFEIGDDFVGIFDGYFTDELCDRYVDYFTELERINHVSPRPERKHIKDDDGCSLISNFFPSKGQTQKFNMTYMNAEFLSIFWNSIYPKYAKRYSILTDLNQHKVIDLVLQKTKPGEGFHVWHCENGTMDTRGRIMVFSLYLNDVEEGGETEFLYLKKRFKPIKDRFLIWPSSYTHTHRGNPPLENDKYIITGWLEYVI
tara:strand:+ start:1615 stop:2226 length:612 start_codon:yes stop_codon:yes gene_type:complete